MRYPEKVWPAKVVALGVRVKKMKEKKKKGKKERKKNQNHWFHIVQFQYLTFALTSSATPPHLSL